MIYGHATEVDFVIKMTTLQSKNSSKKCSSITFHSEAFSFVVFFLDAGSSFLRNKWQSPHRKIGGMFAQHIGRNIMRRVMFTINLI